MATDEPQCAIGSEIETPMAQRELSAFEQLITRNPPILESLFAQITTQSILRLYHTSPYLRQFLQNSPSSWRYISWKLAQPAATTSTVTHNGTSNRPRQSSNYALDRLLLNVHNTFSTRLTSLELDNTAVSGQILCQTVLFLRRDTLQHLSVRGCKNVSLKYHLNPWLQIHALERKGGNTSKPEGFEKLALKSLYAYRCRHHRRRPYFPSSLVRKESDSEPTHDVVKLCHALGIWTDTAWCTTPGPRCHRRTSYLTNRPQQDTREVWVVYDRLWRSRNWLGVNENRSDATVSQRKRTGDCRFWEHGEEAANGEALGTHDEGKSVPTHLRHSHRRFVDDIVCSSCSEPILERCEQCSLLMHCGGCRKTLCASCAFDTPYTRNKNAPEEDKHSIWWAPGYAISPNSMQDQDLPPATVNNGQNVPPSNHPILKFKWCCTEPVFSGGGGMNFGHGINRETDRLRATPLPQGKGWEDSDFATSRADTDRASEQSSARCSTDSGISPEGALGDRWASIDDFYQSLARSSLEESMPGAPVPRNLCDECYVSDRWKLHCKGCALALCAKHDVRDRLKFRICGYKDPVQEKAEFKTRQKAIKAAGSIFMQGKDKDQAEKSLARMEHLHTAPWRSGVPRTSPLTTRRPAPTTMAQAAMTSAYAAPAITDSIVVEAAAMDLEVGAILSSLRGNRVEIELPLRPLSRGSSTSDVASRSSSPAPSTRSLPSTPEPKSTKSAKPTPQHLHEAPISRPRWKGCQSFFCPAIRAPGDARRRCVAIMRQCSECKTYVCGDCTTQLELPCPCKGCQPPQLEDTGTQGSSDTALFFCPNCRWDRMVSRKCKRRTEAFLTAHKGSTKKAKTRKAKFRKPTEARRGSSIAGASSSNISDEVVERLGDFFAGLRSNIGDDGQTVDVENVGDIREIEDVGVLARDLIRRIQSLRGQFRPGSLAAQALPDVTFDENAAQAVQTQESETSEDD